MQEDLKIIKKHYKKIKVLFEKNISIKDLESLKKLKHDEILKSLLIIKENLILIPIIDKDVELDKIIFKIDSLIGEK